MRRPFLRRWLRFSLQSLLLLTALVAALNWAWLEKRNADQYRQEAERLRAENAAQAKDLLGREKVIRSMIEALSDTVRNQRIRERAQARGSEVPEHWLEPPKATAPSSQPMD